MHPIKFPRHEEYKKFCKKWEYREDLLNDAYLLGLNDGYEDFQLTQLLQMLKLDYPNFKCTYIPPLISELKDYLSNRWKNV